jgi:hypothetical protein
MAEIAPDGSQFRLLEETKTTSAIPYANPFLATVNPLLMSENGP